MTHNDKIEFLLSVVRNSGKTDMHAVAKDLGLQFDTARMRLKYITQGFERDKAKASGASGAGTGTGGVTTPKKKVATPRKNLSPTKKFKLETGETMEFGDAQDEDDEGSPTPRPSEYLVSFSCFALRYANHLVLSITVRKYTRNVPVVKYNEESDGPESPPVISKSFVLASHFALWYTNHLVLSITGRKRARTVIKTVYKEESEENGVEDSET